MSLQRVRRFVLLGLGLSACLTASASATADPSESAHAQAQPSEEELAESQAGLGTEKEETPSAEGEAAATSPGTSDSGPEDASDAPATEPGAAHTYGHAGQFGLRAQLAFGYEILIRYDDSPPCDIDGDGGDEKVCAYNTAPSLDLSLSYAFFDSLEPYVWLRLGLSEHAESQTEANRWFGAGLRLYTMADSRLKLFFEPGLALELEGGLPNAPAGANYGTDYVGHLHFGLQYDVLKHLGLYASVGPNVGFVRTLSTELEAAFGLQARAP